MDACDMHPVCLCLSGAHPPMTLTAVAEELAPEYIDVICEGELKQILIVFFAGGLQSCSNLVSDFMALESPCLHEAW